MRGGASSCGGPLHGFTIIIDGAAPGADTFIIPDRLRAMRGPGESYSDVILRVAKG
jgi:hypothetical protein